MFSPNTPAGTQHTHTHTHIRTHAHLIKIQLVCHPFSCCLKLLHHPHDVQGVQRVHNSGTDVSKPKYGRRPPTFCLWIQLVITPSISDIVSPCMNHHLSSVCVGGGGGGGHEVSKCAQCFENWGDSTSLSCRQLQLW